MNAIVWFDKKHWSRGLRISKFIGMLGKGSDGAPQGHRQATGFTLMNFKVEPRVKCCGHKQGPCREIGASVNADQFVAKTSLLC